MLKRTKVMNCYKIGFSKFAEEVLTVKMPKDLSNKMNNEGDTTLEGELKAFDFEVTGVDSGIRVELSADKKEFVVIREDKEIKAEVIELTIFAICEVEASAEVQALADKLEGLDALDDI